MKRIVYILCVTFLFSSCSNEKVTSSIEGAKEIKGDSIAVVQSEIVDTVVKASEQLVVTPEYWESFETEISAIIFFYQGEILAPFEAKIVEGLKKEYNDLPFYELYTNDDYAQVFLNDTLAFDISEYLLDKRYGFVLLKPQYPPNYEYLDDSLSSLKMSFDEFYLNK